MFKEKWFAKRVLYGIGLFDFFVKSNFTQMKYNSKQDIDKNRHWVTFAWAK